MWKFCRLAFIKEEFSTIGITQSSCGQQNKSVLPEQSPQVCSHWLSELNSTHSVPTSLFWNKLFHPHELLKTWPQKANNKNSSQMWSRIIAESKVKLSFILILQQYCTKWHEKTHELCKTRLFLVCQKGHSVNKSKFIGIKAILEWENISHIAVGKKVQLLCNSAEMKKDT